MRPPTFPKPSVTEFGIKDRTQYETYVTVCCCAQITNSTVPMFERLFLDTRPRTGSDPPIVATLFLKLLAKEGEPSHVFCLVSSFSPFPLSSKRCHGNRIEEDLLGKRSLPCPRRFECFPMRNSRRPSLLLLFFQDPPVTCIIFSFKPSGLSAESAVSVELSRSRLPDHHFPLSIANSSIF